VLDQLISGSAEPEVATRTSPLPRQHAIGSRVFHFPDQIFGIWLSHQQGQCVRRPPPALGGVLTVIWEWSSSVCYSPAFTSRGRNLTRMMVDVNFALHARHRQLNHRIRTRHQSALSTS